MGCSASVQSVPQTGVRPETKNRIEAQEEVAQVGLILFL